MTVKVFAHRVPKSCIHYSYLNGVSEFGKTSFKIFATDSKNAEYRTQSKFFYDGRKYCAKRWITQREFVFIL